MISPLRNYISGGHSLCLGHLLREWKNTRLIAVKNQVQLNINVNITYRLYSTLKDKAENVKKLLDESALFENQDEKSWATSPYPKGVYNPRLQSNYALRPRVNPRETSLILFPGEGSQYVGMCNKLLKYPGVNDIFAAANDILKYNLLSLCMQGPKSKLDETKHAQVAVMVCSFAALEKMKEEKPNSVENCIAAAGFGIGELTALTFAGVFSFERAVRLAQLRGEAMQVTSEIVPSGMITVIYGVDTKIHEVLKKAKEHAEAEGVENPVCDVANYLYPHCKVLAGHNQCLDYIEKNYRNLKLKQVRRLNFQGAFNTRLMEPASNTFWKYLQKSNLQDPVIAVHSTRDGKIYHDRNKILHDLSRQIMRPIRWEQMMHVLYERPQGHNFPNTFECGPGNTLKTILKMVNAKAYDVCEGIVDN